MNHVRVDDYFRDIDAGRFPIMRGFHYSETDLRLHLLFQELQGLAVDRKRYGSMFDRDVREEYSAIWKVLVDKEWATIDERFVSIVGDGVFYLPLIQNLLSHDRSEAMRKERVQRNVSVSHQQSIETEDDPRQKQISDIAARAS